LGGSQGAFWPIRGARRALLSALWRFDETVLVLENRRAALCGALRSGYGDDHRRFSLSGGLVMEQIVRQGAGAPTAEIALESVMSRSAG